MDIRGGGGASKCNAQTFQKTQKLAPRNGIKLAH
jgi:hypothetical protein